MIRQARPSDCERIAELSGQLGYPVSAEEVGERMGGILPDPAQALWVSSIGEETVGWIHFLVQRRLEIPEFIEIAALVVDKARRGRQIGSSLLRAAEKWAREKGVPNLRVNCNVIRERSHAFYRRMGFSLVKTQGVFNKSLS